MKNDISINFIFYILKISKKNDQDFISTHTILFYAFLNKKLSFNFKNQLSLLIS
jgi:hypothetical protein